MKGLGVHGAARLSYKLDRPWGRFQSEIGIDDSTAGGGSAGFRVFVNGKLKYTSPAVRGGATRGPFRSIWPARSSWTWSSITAKRATCWTTPIG